MTVPLPYRFDTTSGWHTLLRGAFALNATLLLGIPFKVLTGHWPTALALLAFEAAVFVVTRLFVRFQDGSLGTLYLDRVEVESNAVLGVPLPGPRGVYARERFSAVRVDFMMGPISVDGQSGGPHELVWLAGRDGTPDVLLARTRERTGRAVATELGALLDLPVEEKNAPKVIEL